MKLSYKQLIVGGLFLAVCAVSGYVFSKKKVRKDIHMVQILTSDSYIEVIEEIRKLYSEQYYTKLFKVRTQRRRYAPKSLEYQRIMQDFNKETKSILEDSTSSIIRKYRTNLKTFENSVNYYDSDPELKTYAENLSYPTYQCKEEPVSSLEEIKDILSYFSQRFKDLGVEDMELDDYMVVSSQVEDEVYARYGLEIEAVNAGYQLYEGECAEIAEPMKSQTSYILAAADDSFEL